MPKNQSKIVIRKVVKKHGHGHHGGSWKVAYADFVTAMMAFFMVMWILGMDQNVRQAIEGYFTNPIGLKNGYSTGSSPISSGSSPGAVRTNPVKLITRSYEEQRFRQLGRQIQERIKAADELGTLAAQIEVVMTEKGLRIELVEGRDGETFFAFGSARLKPAAAQAILLLGGELRRTNTPLVVEGHTDSAPLNRHGYTNWELSADRANAARRQLEAAGLDGSRVREIRGYADHDLRNPSDPLDRSNRRITILLPFSSPTPAVPGVAAAPDPGRV